MQLGVRSSGRFMAAILLMSLGAPVSLGAEEGPELPTKLERPMGASLAAVSAQPPESDGPENELAASLEWRGDEVSDIHRVHGLFSMLPRLAIAEAPPGQPVSSLEAFFRQRGFDPASPMVRELVDTAARLDASHPMATPPDEIERYIANEDSEGLEAYLREHWRARYLELGRLFGEWAARRQREGYDVGPLLDRLFENQGITQFSTDSEEVTLSRFAELEAAFQQGAAEQLEELPVQLQRGTGR